MERVVYDIYKNIIGIHLTKEMKDLHNEMSKALMRSSEYTNKQVTISCLSIGRINIFIMSILLKVTYRFNAILITALITFFTEIGKIIQTFIWNHKRLFLNQSNLEQKRQC